MEENIWDKDGETADYAGNSIHIVIRENNLIGKDSKADRYVGRVLDMGTLTKEDIVQDIVTLGKNEGVGYDTLIRLWGTAELAVIDRVKRGFRVTGAVCDVGLSVKGTFASRHEKYDAKKHSIEPRFTAGAPLTEALKGLEAETVQSRRREPVITKVYDVESEGSTVLTPGGVLEVTGDNIRITDGDDEGVYFVREADGTEIKVDRKKIPANRSGKVRVIVPALDAGEYKIRIATRYIGSTKVFRKESLSALSESVLSVK